MLQDAKEYSVEYRVFISERNLCYFNSLVQREKESDQSGEASAANYDQYVHHIQGWGDVSQLALEQQSLDEDKAVNAKDQ